MTTPRRDRELGMDRVISRRDFLQGSAAGVAAGAAFLSGCGPGAAPRPDGPAGMAGLPPAAAGHPPSRLGLRGSHDGAFEVAHQMAFEKRTEWGPAREPDAGEYDLVVVGAGISGLAAAFFHREQHPDARVLLLENHDDFGGHARRNEFEWNGRTILGYGGSQSLQEPSSYSEVAQGLLERIGIHKERLRAAYDEGFYRRHGLGTGVYFDAATYGTDRVVLTDLIDASLFAPVAPAKQSVSEAIAQMPISPAARAELQKLVAGGEDGLPDHSIFAEPEYLLSISYRDLLTKHVGITQPEVHHLLHAVPAGFFGHGIDAIPALYALGFGLPGIGLTSLGSVEGLLRGAMRLLAEPYLFHFPDGNATVTRLLVSHLIPAVADCRDMEAAVGARFDYTALDRPDQEVRLRLGSTVVRVQHEGDPKNAERVAVTYVRDGVTEQVKARRVVLACYNMAIPYLCPELPEPQKQALRQIVKVPLVYSSVLLRNWRAFEQLGLAVAQCPGSWHQMVMVDFPVSLGDYRFSPDPDEPVVLHMSRAAGASGSGHPHEQSRAGRYEILGTSFETIERGIRTHLAGMLGAGGFDPAADIAGLAVNRWPHGYAPEPYTLFDGKPAAGQAPHEIGRQRFGRVAIANSDAGALAYVDAAIDQAWRAVGELAS